MKRRRLFIIMGIIVLLLAAAVWGRESYLNKYQFSDRHGGSFFAGSFYFAGRKGLWRFDPESGSKKLVYRSTDVGDDLISGDNYLLFQSEKALFVLKQNGGTAERLEISGLPNDILAFKLLPEYGNDPKAVMSEITSQNGTEYWLLNTETAEAYRYDGDLKDVERVFYFGKKTMTVAGTQGNYSVYGPEGEKINTEAVFDCK